MLSRAKQGVARLDSIGPRGFWLTVAALTLVRCVLTWRFQMVYTWVGGAPLDDELMFRAAQSITAGQWLGAYDYLTLSKAMFFPVWLAFLHAVHLPYLLGGALLWCAASLAAAGAFAPLLRTRGRQLVLYLMLAFLPSSWAAYTLRVYRDNIFPALCLLFFAGWAGAALRAVQKPKQAPLWPWLVLAGLGLACSYLDREDAGLFLLPFAVVGTVILACVLRGRMRALLCLPYALLAAGMGVFCLLNQAYYGYRDVSDFSGGAFAQAMGAMMRVDTDNADLLLSVPADARALIYEVSPAAARLQYWLEEDESLRNSFVDPGRNDYRAGSFYWAVRRAAYYEGQYTDPQTAARFWEAVAHQINAACDDGTLPSRTGRRSSTTQPIAARYMAPTLAETARSFAWVLLCRDCRPCERLRSIGTEEDIALWSAYLNGTPINVVAEAGKDTPYYNLGQYLAYAAMQAWRIAYVILWNGLLLWAVARQLRALPAVLRTRTAGTAVPWLLLFGLLGMALLRCAMIAFVEVSSFGIGTYTMYLASVHPLLALYAVAGSLGRPEGGKP